MTTKQRQTLGAVLAAIFLVLSLVVGRSSCGPQPTPVPVPSDAALPTPSDAASDVAIDAPAQCSFVGPRARMGAAQRELPRIVGGTSAPEGAFPYAVGVATPTRFQYCGGTLIGSRYVLTAAHCQVEVGDLALVGSNDLTKARAVKIVESRINPKFDPVLLDFDVAIAVLAEDVQLETAPLAEISIPTPTTGTIIGWGRTTEGGSTTTQLQEVDVPIWNHDDCARIYPQLTNRQVCAGEGGKDACQGDSGGALLVNQTTLHQLGIVSYGIGCARPGIPGVFTDTRAPEIRSWIDACAH